MLNVYMLCLIIIFLMIFWCNCGKKVNRRISQVSNQNKTSLHTLKHSHIIKYTNWSSLFLPFRMRKICVLLQLSLKTLFYSSWTGRRQISKSNCQQSWHFYCFYMNFYVYLCMCRCFVLIDSSTLEQTRGETETDTQTHLESLVELGLSSTVSTILTQCSMEIYKVVQTHCRTLVDTCLP